MDKVRKWKVDKSVNKFFFIFLIVPLFSFFFSVVLFAEDSKVILQSKIEQRVSGVAVSLCSNYIAVGTESVKKQNLNPLVYLFDIRGNMLWKYELQDGPGIDTSLCVSRNGEYVAAADNWRKCVYFFNKKGELLWKQQLNEDVEAIRSLESIFDFLELTVGTGEVVYGFSREGALLSRDAEPRHSFMFSFGTWDGKYWYLGSDNYAHFIMQEDNGPREIFKWKPDNMEESGDIISTKISPDGTYMLVTTSKDYIYVFKDDGKVLWSRKIDKLYRTAISAKGLVVAGTSEGDIYMISTQTE